MGVKCSVKNCPNHAAHRYAAAGLDMEACDYHRLRVRAIIHKYARHMLEITDRVRDKYEDEIYNMEGKE